MQKTLPPPLFQGQVRTPEQCNETVKEFLENEDNILDPQLQELESLYQHKLVFQECQLRELREKLDDIKCGREEDRVRFAETLAEKDKELRESIASLEVKQEEDENAREEYGEYIRKHYESVAKQVEQEHSFEIATLHAKINEFERRQIDRNILQKQASEIVELKRSAEIMRGELANQKSEFIAQMAQKDAAHAARLAEETRDLRNAKETLTEALQSKTMEAVHMAQKVEKLAADRNALQHALAEANEKLGPLERDIALLHQQGDLYETERVQNADSLAGLNHKISELNTKIKSQANALQKERAIIRVREQSILNFQNALYELMHSEERDQEGHLTHGLLELYDNFVAGSELEATLADPDDGHLGPETPAKSIQQKLPVLEFMRQRQALQRVVHCKSRDAKRAESQLTQHKRNSQAQHAVLLADNKSLRRRLVSLERKNRLIESQLFQSKQQVDQLRRRRGLTQGKNPVTNAGQARVTMIDEIINDARSCATGKLPPASSGTQPPPTVSSVMNPALNQRATALQSEVQSIYDEEEVGSPQWTMAPPSRSLSTSNLRQKQPPIKAKVPKVTTKSNKDLLDSDDDETRLQDPLQPWSRLP